MGFYSIDMFNSNHDLIGNSDQFLPSSGQWTSVELPDVPYEGTFYVMLHVIVQGLSDVLPLDLNGPGVSTNPAWFYDGSLWAKLSSFGFSPSVVLIRAEGISQDDSKSLKYAEVVSSSSHNAELSQLTASSNLPFGRMVLSGSAGVEPMIHKSVSNMIGYDVYRRNIGLIYPWLPSDTTVWEKIASTAETQYADNREGLWMFGNMMHEYYVTAL